VEEKKTNKKRPGNTNYPVMVIYLEARVNGLGMIVIGLGDWEPDS
jgi:hypothetical protein